NEVDQRLRLSERIDQCIRDPRDPRYITHFQRDLLQQRAHAIALGYEDVNDHTKLRKDPALLVAVKNNPDEESPLGSASTLSRLENRITETELSALSKIPVEVFLESYKGKKPPKKIIIDADATADLIHGEQEKRYFNGFYNAYCFLPIYFFCGTQLLWSHLRPSSKGGAHGAVAIFHYLATRIKQEWPDCEIILRGDAGFYSPLLLAYCERRGYKYILGYSSNDVLKRLSAHIVFASEMFFVGAGSQEPFRLFWEYKYQAKNWKHARKIIVKAERLPDKDDFRGKENTRYIVTNLEGTPTELYEEVYCARGDMENRIKEQQLWLFADRTSCHDFLANRFRLLLSSFAYILIETIRRTALVGTEMASAQCGTIREKLFKIAAVVKVSVRRIKLALPTSCPVKELWMLVFDRLRAGFSLPSS
ncbi:MAG: IS1380 family transposase, partial [Planctomycetaceae bacterium]|nr:IS1380 family transposase [Planctomycetaceae bacterium]